MGEQEPVEGRAEPRGTTFRRRAANVFLAFAALALFGVLLAIGFGQGRVDGTMLLVVVLVTGASGAGCYALSSALSTGRTWAPGVAVPVLWVVLVAGIVGVVVDFAASKLTIPLDAILAAWALSAADRPPARARGAGLAAIALTLVLVGPRFVEPALTIARGMTATDSEDLRFALRTNCYGPADRSAGTIVFVVEWSWTRTDPLADGHDAIEVRWNEASPVVLRDGFIEAPAGVRSIMEPFDDGISSPALDVLVREHPEPPAVRFDLPRSVADAGGTITIPFEPTTPDAAIVDFAARYARGTEWRIAAVTACDLPLPATAP